MIIAIINRAYEQTNKQTDSYCNTKITAYVTTGIHYHSTAVVEAAITIFTLCLSFTVYFFANKQFL